MYREHFRQVGLMSRLAPCLLAAVMFPGIGWLVSSAIGQTAGTSDPSLAGATTRPAEADVSTRPPSAEEILQQLMRERPAGTPIAPSEPGHPAGAAEEVQPLEAVTSHKPDRPLRPEGSMLVDRAGRLVREGNWWTFVFESNKTTSAEAPVRLLPNQMLETMEIASAGGTRSAVFLVSGEITEFHGSNYLLLRKVLVRRDLGNLR